MRDWLRGENIRRDRLCDLEGFLADLAKRPRLEARWVCAPPAVMNIFSCWIVLTAESISYWWLCSSLRKYWLVARRRAVYEPSISKRCAMVRLFRRLLRWLSWSSCLSIFFWSATVVF